MNDYIFRTQKRTNKIDLYDERWPNIFELMVIADTRYWSDGIVICGTYNPPGLSKPNSLGAVGTDISFLIESVTFKFIL